MPELCPFCKLLITPPCLDAFQAFSDCGIGDGTIHQGETMKPLLLAPVLLAGCAPLMNGIAPTDCYDATSGSISVTNSVGAVLIAKPAETVRFCPPSIRKVPPTEAVAANAPKVAP